MADGYPSSHPDFTAWSGDEEPVISQGGLGYACLDCNWTGTGRTAYAHHRGQHHPIVLRDAPQYGPVPFTCCATQQKAS
jgi:hypothetical protein